MIAIHAMNAGLWQKNLAVVAQIEASTYEPARQDPIDFLTRVARHPRGVSTLAVEAERIVGFCLGAPLEMFSNVSGADTDPTLHQGTTLYSADTLIDPDYRGRGLGKRLKAAQVQHAFRAGYKVVSGRNRAVFAAAMWRINRSLGGHAIRLIENDYDDRLKPNVCIYYHIETSSHGSHAASR